MIRGPSEVFLVEGAFDWLTLVERGYPTVALLGSHLQQELVSELENTQRIFIVTDSDEPGRKFAWQLADIFDQRACIVPSLPKVKDLSQLPPSSTGW